VPLFDVMLLYFEGRIFKETLRRDLLMVGLVASPAGDTERIYS